MSTHRMTSTKMSFFHMVFPLLRRAPPAAPKPLTTHEVFKTASPRRNAGSKHIDASVSVSFCPHPATASAEGAQLNGRPFPATASAEGAQFNGPPSLWERALTEVRVLATSWAPRPGP